MALEKEITLETHEKATYQTIGSFFGFTANRIEKTTTLKIIVDGFISEEAYLAGAKKCDIREVSVVLNNSEISDYTNMYVIAKKSYQSQQIQQI